MLKIKDNVDLKKLKKYGVITSPKEIDSRKLNTKLVKAIIVDDDEGNKMTISDKRTIDLYDWCDNNHTLDVLYDLIKADLVEKVEDNEK